MSPNRADDGGLHLRMDDHRISFGGVINIAEIRSVACAQDDELPIASDHLQPIQRHPIWIARKAGRYRSGQTGQTVNLLALRLRWFESSPAQILLRMRSCSSVAF